MRTSFRELGIANTKNHEFTLIPMIVPKRGYMADDIEEVNVSLYSKGTGKSDIEKQIREVYNFKDYNSSITRITDKVSNDIVAERTILEPVHLIIGMDGMS